jgi:hypothetical protein
VLIKNKKARMPMTMTSPLVGCSLFLAPMP